MVTQGVERKLAAILVADVVGYGRLMGADEAGTLARLQAHLSDLVQPKVADHRGRVVKLMGDGVLAEFASVVDAVQCAAEVQRGMAARNTDVAKDRRIEFRIGVNLGDIITQGDDIHGDGVNIAARMEGLAEPGGICICGFVHDQVQNKLALDFEDMGTRQVKNIAKPVHVYRILADQTPARSPGNAGGPTPSLALPDRPSIVVLPFANVSGDPEQEYFADGVTQEVITALSRIRWIFVIASNSSFAYKGRTPDVREVANELGVRYVVEGSVRQAGNRIRIMAQLIDGTTGNHVWAQRYDRELSEIFALQDELTQTIVVAIEPELGKAERQRARLRRPDSIDAWTTYQRGMSHLYRISADNLAQAQDLFRQAIDLDPRLGPAYSGLAETYYLGSVYGLTGSPAEARATALEPALKAVELDDTDAAAHCTLGRVHTFRREHDAAIPEFEAALELNPSHALAHYGLGAARTFSGMAADAIASLESAIRLSPHDPLMGSFLVRMADAHLLVRKYEAAVDWARKALRQPNFQWSRYAVLVSALGHLGRIDEAKRALADLRERRPDFSFKFVRDNHLYTDADDFEHYLDGLRLAGVRE